MSLDILQTPSVNFDERRQELSMLVLHYTGMETGRAALERMCDPDAKVAAHYMVEEDGQIYQLVDENKRAWHAGVASWQGLEDINSRSIGIEIVNGGHDYGLPDFPEVQIDAVIALCKGVLSRHDIFQSSIVGHSDIAPGRKDDPGEKFPWSRLCEEGIGLWPSKENALAVGSVQQLAEIGYEITAEPSRNEVYAVVKAFQQRWMQDNVTGDACLETLCRIAQVAAAYKENGKALA